MAAAASIATQKMRLCCKNSPRCASPRHILAHAIFAKQERQSRVFGQVGRLLWPSQEEAYVPRELIRTVGGLQASTGGKHKMVVFIEVVDSPEVKPRAVV